MKKCLIIISMLLFLSSINSAGDLEEKINKINREIEKNIIAGNVEAQLKHYTDDAYSLPNFSPMMHGKDEFLSAHEQGEAMGIKITKFKLETVDIIDGENFAIEIGKYSLTLTMPGMPTPIEDAGKYLTVFEKQDDGSLKIKVDTWNADKNPVDYKAEGEVHGGEYGME